MNSSKIQRIEKIKPNLKILEEKDVSQAYVNWFLDKEVTRYSDNQYRDFSLDGQKKYVNTCLADQNVDLYGIFDNHIHIGNIVISGLKSLHKRAEITYVVGDKSYWGLGIASFAIAEIVKLSKSVYRLHKLCAGIAHDNLGSRSVLEKNGFLLEGIRKDHLIYNAQYYDQLDFGLII